MPDSPRTYRSSLRADQARATRRRIVDTARALFVEEGYARTTIDAVAERAGVSRKTVFNSVGGKAELLTLAWDWALVGDDEPVAMFDRPEVQAAFAHEEADHLLSDWFRINCGIAHRLAPLMPVVLVAADGDSDARALLDVNLGARRKGARRFVERLAELGGLRPELTVPRATAVVELLMDPMPCRQLVLDGPWTFDDYVGFVERQARAALLPDRRRR